MVLCGRVDCEFGNGEVKCVGGCFMVGYDYNESIVDDFSVVKIGLFSFFRWGEVVFWLNELFYDVYFFFGRFVSLGFFCFVV